MSKQLVEEFKILLSEKTNDEKYFTNLFEDLGGRSIIDKLTKKYFGKKANELFKISKDDNGNDIESKFTDIYIMKVQ